MHHTWDYSTKRFFVCIEVSPFTIQAQQTNDTLILCRLFVGLPPELQPLGNEYARDEFKRHKKCNETEAKLFMVEWTNYAVQLSQQLGLGVRGKPAAKVGDNLKVDDLDKFSESQIVQLYELMRVATNPDEDTEQSTDEPNTAANSSESKTPNKDS